MNMDLCREEVSGLMRSLLRSLEMTPEKEKVLHEQLYSKLSRISAEMTSLSGGTANKSCMEKRCPCEFKELQACSDNCSCRNPIMSGGCTRCATYGSYEQQLAMARRLVNASDDLS
jgi:hypothetical protein